MVLLSIVGMLAADLKEDGVVGLESFDGLGTVVDVVVACRCGRVVMEHWNIGTMEPWQAGVL